MKFSAALAVLIFVTSPALAGEMRQVPHGMVVTTDSGEQVRVLAYADGTLRITNASDALPEARSTAMVDKEPDGQPVVSVEGDSAI
ncbi:MAG: hypothetical protein WBA55_04295, partial [Allopontixanthobacter sediminis]